MRKHEDREEKIVTRRVCVEVRCDACGCIAEYPQNDTLNPFVYQGIGCGGGRLRVSYYFDDQSDDFKELDLCYDCAAVLVRDIQQGEWKRGDRHG